MRGLILVLALTACGGELGEGVEALPSWCDDCVDWPGSHPAVDEDGTVWCYAEADCESDSGCAVGEDCVDGWCATVGCG